MPVPPYPSLVACGPHHTLAARLRRAQQFRGAVAPRRVYRPAQAVVAVRAAGAQVCLSATACLPFWPP